MEVGALVVWWVVAVGLLGAGLPLGAWVFPEATDRGAFIAFPLAVLVLILPVYWVGQLVYGPLVALGGLLVLVLVSIALTRRGHTPHRGRALEIVGVFTAAFLFLLAIRSVDPAAHPGGGEKFLDLGILQSLLRSGSLPPVDMWFAGDHVLYYYGGHLVAATVAHLTGIPGRIAYNLALITAYAGAVTVVYGFAAEIAARRDLDRSVAGGLGAVFFGLASNLFTPAGLVGTVVGGGFLEHLASATGRTVAQARVTVDSFGYWWASRVIPGTITEFPLFAYLNGDLHAHMTDTTILLLIAAVGYAYYRSRAPAVWRRRILVFGVAPPAIGFLTVVNTWSLPTGVGLIWLALIFAPAPPWQVLPGTPDPSALQPGFVGEQGARVLVATLLAVPVLGLALLWVAPYVTNILLVGGPSEGLAFVVDHTGLWALLVAHGGFLLVFLWYLLGFTHGEPRGIAVTAVILALTGLAASLLDAPVLVTVVPLAIGIWLLHQRRIHDDDSGLPGYEAVLLVAGAGLVMIVDFVYLNDPASGGRFNTVFKVYAQVWPLWAAGAAVMLTAILDRGVSTPTGRFEIRGRSAIAAVFLAGLLLYATLAMLEHFEAYVRVWVNSLPTAALAAGLLALLILGVMDYLDEVPDKLVAVGQRLWAGARLHPVIAIALVVALVLNGGLALAAGSADVPAHEPSLDAVAFVHVSHPGEAGAIEWLNDREGQPVLATAPGVAPYDWSSPASSLTGLPTIIGWTHEANYRSDSLFQERVQAVDTLYRGTPAQRASLLRTYDVRYIYVGPNEQERYGQSDLSFGAEPGISVAIEAGSVTIYEVDQSALLSAQT